MDEGQEIYHEKQKWQLCAIHVLNNLLQEKDAFTKKEMDDICTNLSPQKLVNPHRSMLGLGNYDVNVVMAALQSRDLSVVWFDKRKKLNNIKFEKVKGCIVNIPSRSGIGFLKLPLKFKHWLVIRKIKDTYYNLDSKLSSPEVIGQSEASLMDYLGEFLKQGDGELLLVVKPEDCETLYNKPEVNQEINDINTEQSKT